MIFYGKLYDEFYKKYKSYDELPESWRNSKKAVADLVLELTTHGEKLLSIGCGNGYVEYLLRKEGRNITAIEPSIKAVVFLKQFSAVNLYEGYFPDCLKNKGEGPFDLAYMSGTEYCFNKQEFAILLKQIYDFGISKFLIISASWYDSFAVKQRAKDFIKRVLSSLKLYELGQFWGISERLKNLNTPF